MNNTAIAVDITGFASMIMLAINVSAAAKMSVRWFMTSARLILSTTPTATACVRVPIFVRIIPSTMWMTMDSVMILTIAHLMQRTTEIAMPYAGIWTRVLPIDRMTKTAMQFVVTKTVVFRIRIMMLMETTCVSRRTHARQMQITTATVIVCV